MKDSKERYFNGTIQNNAPERLMCVCVLGGGGGGGFLYIPITEPFFSTFALI